MSDLNTARPLAAGASARQVKNGELHLDCTANTISCQFPDFPTVEPVSIYAVALALLDAGYSLVPCKPGSKWIRSGFGPAQKRVTSYGDCYHQFVELRSNLGILTGGDPGLCVFDCDSERIYLELIGRWPVLGGTFTVRTVTPGHYHVYTLAGDLPSGVVGGLEVKAHGRVVVGPASVVNGKRYTPLDWKAPIVRINPAEFSFFSALTQVKPVALKKENAPTGNDLIGRLKKAWALLEVCELHGIKLTGSGRLRQALCPFHNESKGSFTLDLERGLWRCFGCDRHGDVINLFSLLEGLSVPEAIRVMARRLPGGAR